MKKKGFTLVETLSAIGIITVLAGISLPVLVNSKKSAHATDDLSKLRQLGVAAALYADNYGEFPLSTSQLVEAGLAPKEICATTLDKSVSGIANDLIDFNNERFGHIMGQSNLSYKATFVGPGDFGLGQEVFRTYILSGPAAGWLIDASESQKVDFPTPTQWKGTYKRLLVDGAVVTRRHQDYQCYNGGKREACRMSTLLYVDPNPVFEELQKSQDQ